MSQVKVNTSLVVNAANNIKKLNNQLNNKFNDLQNAFGQLNAAWDGTASNNAISRFNEFKASYPQDRYKVVDNFVKFLYDQVGEGYEQTETVVTSLADSFK